MCSVSMGAYCPVTFRCAVLIVTGTINARALLLTGCVGHVVEVLVYSVADVVYERAGRARRRYGTPYPTAFRVAGRGVGST